MGRTGHQIVAQIAKHFLDPTTAKTVQKYLGSTTFEDAAVWMAEMRSNPVYSLTKTWHYLNLEKDAVYVTTDGEDIVARLILTINELKHKQTLSDAQIKTDLLLLFHLLGDLHQRLHVGYGIDKGGNTIKVDFLGMPTNLHSVWDNGIIEHEHITTEDCLTTYHDIPSGTLSVIKNIDVVFWMNDSRQHLMQVYNFTGGKLDEAYSSQNKIPVEWQLIEAGIRLASVLPSHFA